MYKKLTDYLDFKNINYHVWDSHSFTQWRQSIFGKDKKETKFFIETILKINDFRLSKDYFSVVNKFSTRISTLKDIPENAHYIKLLINEKLYNKSFNDFKFHGIVKQTLKYLGNEFLKKNNKYSANVVGKIKQGRIHEDKRENFFSLK